MSEPLRLDEHGEEQLHRWAWDDNPTSEQWAWVDQALDKIAEKAPYVAIGVVVTNRVNGDVAITCPQDDTLTIVVIPWPGEADTFSLRYVGNLDHL